MLFRRRHGYSRAMKRAVILAGTGAIGWATTRHLTGAGYDVVVTGRDPAHVPPGLIATGATFVQGDRNDASSLSGVLARGADLVVDCACFSADQARALQGYLGDVTSTVMISSKAVYVDAAGRHSNSDIPPQFDGPITEGQPTLGPNGADFNTRAGYGANKVAAEAVLLASDHPVTVLRPSKIHGSWSRQPREWYFVKRALDGRPAVLLANRGIGADHPSAALNIAALIQVVAEKPGQRILNVADPDCPDGRTIASIVADQLGHSWQEVLLDGDAPAGLGRHPWDRIPKVELDTSAAARLGYTPVGDYATTVRDEIQWLVEVGSGMQPGNVIEWSTPGPLDYALEDDYRRAHCS